MVRLQIYKIRTHTQGLYLRNLAIPIDLQLKLFDSLITPILKNLQERRFKKFWLKRLQNDATAKTTLKKHKCRFVLVPKCLTQVPKCPGAEVSSIQLSLHNRPANECHVTMIWLCIPINRKFSIKHQSVLFCYLHILAIVIDAYKKGQECNTKSYSIYY